MEVLYHPPTGLRAALPGRPFDQWRYRELLPVAPGAALPSVVVGGTPVSEAPRLAARLGAARVVIKDEGRNPSASSKDRPSAVAVVMAVAAGIDSVCCASTGNAGTSLACLAASMGLVATIFVPLRIPAPKLVQLGVFGAQVLRVAADYDRTWELSQAIASRKGWYNRNCAINPYLVEGKKTVALELAEQLGERMPAWVAVSVGDGCTYAAVVRGLEEAFDLCFIPFVPRVLGVQADGARPLVDAFEGDGLLRLKPATTIADSIAVGHPRNFLKALLAARRNDGCFLSVSDAQILTATSDCARLAGIFGEPAAAAAVAGVGVAIGRGVIRPEEAVAILVTGNGLKDPAAALSAVEGPLDVPPDEALVERLLLDLAPGLREMDEGAPVTA